MILKQTSNSKEQIMATKLEKVQAIIEELKELCETLIIGCVVIDDDNNKENGFAFVQGRSKFITEGLYEILKKSFVADREMRVANNLLLQPQFNCFNFR